MDNSEEKQENYWVSFSDIMTSLMVIFLFIAVSYMSKIQKEEKRRTEAFQDYKESKESIYNELSTEFQNDLIKQNIIVVDKDLSVKFTNPNFLFDQGSFEIKPQFAKVLNGFLPRYFNILRNEKYKNKIAEIRIEGHTDAVGLPAYDKDPYLANILLSQQRSANVLRYFTNSLYYQKLSLEEKDNLRYLITANGLSYGRPVDDNFELIRNSKKNVNIKNSKRVEFKVVTTSSALVDDVIKNL